MSRLTPLCYPLPEYNAHPPPTVSHSTASVANAVKNEVSLVFFLYIYERRKLVKSNINNKNKKSKVKRAIQELKLYQIAARYIRLG